MPTLRERTSTSSAAMVGMSTSRTTAFCGSSNTSAFIRPRSSLVDQHLDLICLARRERREGVRRIVEGATARDDTLDRQVARGALRCDPLEVVDPVAPRADDRQVVERPQHRLDRRLADEEPGLCERAPPTERANARVEATRVPGAFDGHVDAETVALLTEELRYVDGRRVEDCGDAERLGARPPRRIRLRDVDGGGARRARAQRGQS